MSDAHNTSIVRRNRREGFTLDVPVEEQTFASDGLILRPWEFSDAPSLVLLRGCDPWFEGSGMPHPTSVTAALRYVRRVAPRAGSRIVVRAITEDLRTPLGEASLSPTHVPDQCDLGYRPCASSADRGLAERVLKALLPIAAELAYREVRLRIEVGNETCEEVASATGFCRQRVLVSSSRVVSAPTTREWLRALS